MKQREYTDRFRCVLCHDATHLLTIVVERAHTLLFFIQCTWLPA